MSDRDDLAALIYRHTIDGMDYCRQVADTILAAGWRPPTAQLYDPQRDDGCPQCVAIRTSATA